MVGLGETASEYETKWNRKIGQFYPDYTQKSQELSDLKKKVEEFETEKTRTKEEKGEELSPEELKKRALAEADQLGIVHTGNVNKFIDAYLQARDLIDDAEAVVAKAEEDGKPKATQKELLDYMNETGIKNPELAYRAKFDKELDEWKEKQLAKVKKTGMQTLDTSSAGAKQPEQKTPKSFDELRDSMRSYLQNRGQA